MTMLVDMGAEPAEEGGEVALGELGVEGTEIARGSLHELSGVEIAEGVGGEVADESSAPVDILEDTIGIGGWGDSEEALVALIPGVG